MLKNLLFVVGFFMIVSGCSARNYQQKDEDLYGWGTMDEGRTALEGYSAGNDCTGSNANTVKLKIEQIASKAASSTYSDQYIDTSEVLKKHTELSFKYAEEAFKKGCLDEADNAYRDIIKFYIGEAYSGIRDRAKLGIDDIRALRDKNTHK
jgi:hypothetical protein